MVLQRYSASMKTPTAASLAAVLLSLVGPGVAATNPAKTSKPAARAAKAPVRKPPPLPEATPEQMDAAGRVFYGHYECELHQAIDIAASPEHSGYVDVRHGKAVYVMKPV